MQHNIFTPAKRRKKPIPKCRIDLGLLFEGCIRHSTLWQLLKEKEIKFPSEEVEVIISGDADQEQEATEEDLKKEKEPVNEKLTVDEVITNMVVLFPRTKEEVTARLRSVIAVLRDDLEAVQRLARELVEDAASNGVKYLEVGLDPSKFITKETGQYFPQRFK